MKLADLRPGMRVQRRGDSSCFIPDRRDQPFLRGRRIGIVTAVPDRSAGPNPPVVIRWEGSERTEAIRVQRLEPAPVASAPSASAPVVPAPVVPAAVVSAPVASAPVVPVPTLSAIPSLQQQVIHGAAS